MVISRVAREAIAAALVLGALQSMHIRLLKAALSIQERAAAVQIATSYSELLNQSQKEKDDLVMVRILARLRKVPGVVEAFTVEPEVRVRAPGSYSFPLKWEGHAWANLILVLSDRIARRLVFRHWWIGTAASALLGGGFFFYTKRKDKERKTLQASVLELETNLGTEIRRRKTAEDRERKTLIHTGNELRQALEHVPDPLIRLDGLQRLVAFNTAAQTILHIETPEAFLQKSWHEIPALSACGKAIETSMSAPGQPVVWGEPGRAYKLLFKTDSSVGGGTWIAISVE